VLFGLVCALFSAVCHGFASALQAVAARATKDEWRGVDPRLLLRLFTKWPFIFSVGLNAVGLVAQIVALRTLPLFLVQAAQAASIAVTAPLAVKLFKTRLSRVEWTAVAAVCAGLSLLGLSAQGGGAGHGSQDFHRWLLVGSLLLVLLGFLAGQLPDAPRNALLGLISGFAFGGMGIAIRVLPGLAPITLLGSAAAYAVIMAGVAAAWFFTAALQRGGVVTATAMMLIGETIPPSVIGVVVLGDSARPGWTPVAFTGFAVAVAGAILLARFGEIHPVDPSVPKQAMSQPLTKRDSPS
jgi:drug/metabolite transporter (DMT)-like permease